MKKIIALLILSLTSMVVYSSKSINNLAIHKFFNKNDTATWILFTKIHTDNDDHYHGAIQFTKNNKENYRLIIQLIDDEKKVYIINQDIEAIIKKRKINEWPMGEAFISFNPINKRWLIDLPKNNAHAGLHLNIDLNNKVIKTNNIIAGKAETITGHLKPLSSTNPDQFITGSNNKYLLAFLNNTLKNNIEINSFICEADNKTSVFNLKINYKNIKNYLSGWEQEGKLKILTGQITPSLSDKTWIIAVARPKFYIETTAFEPYNTNHFISMALTKKSKATCFISKQTLNS